MASWWQATKVAGKGTLATALLLSLGPEGISGHGYLWVYMPIWSFFDKAAAMASFPEGGFFHVHFLKYYFVLALPIMLLAVIWTKPWPLGVRDPVSAVILCTLQQAALYQGTFTAFHLYSWLGGPDGSTLTQNET